MDEEKPLSLHDLKEWLNLIFDLVVMGTVVIIPLLFWNLTSEFYETPKFLALIILTAVLLIIWVSKCLVNSKVSITHTPLDLPLLLLLIVFIISTFFAPARYLAIFGNLPRINGGLAAFVIFVTFYLVIVSNLKQVNTIKMVINLLLGVGVALSVLGLVYYAGLNIIPLPWTNGLNFTPTGSSFSTTALLVLLLPFPIISILQGKELKGNLTQKLIFTAILTLFATTIVLTGSLPIYIAALLAFGLALFVTPPTSIEKNLPYLALPVVMAIFLAFVSFLPIAGNKNLLYAQAQKFPREVQLSVADSWKISVSAFRDSPFWGAGPASYLSSFTTYKPMEFNNSKTWNIRFDQGFNEYFQILANLGALGLIALLLLTAVFISAALKALTSPQGSLGLSLAISGLLFFILLALHPSTMLLWIIGLIILASFMTIHKHFAKQLYLSMAAPQRPKSSSDEDELYIQFDIFPLILMLAILAALGFTFFFVGKYALADYYHRQALNIASSGGSLLDAYQNLVNTEKLNPYVDVYHLDLAQTNFAIANAIASAKAPTEASPSGSLTDEDKQNIQTLLSQAITEGRNATALNPNNPTNWEVLGAIYRQISGVAQNALTFSLDAYGRAIQKDPLNPNLRLTVGTIYYSVKSYDMAIRFFTDAINLKPDFANGYYNLAIALKDKGDLVSAVSSAERAVSLLDPKNSDYKVASNLLAGLKDTIASQSAAQQAQVQTQPEVVGAKIADELKSSSALQGKNLPKVLNLPKTENIATPEAIKKQTPE